MPEKAAASKDEEAARRLVIQDAVSRLPERQRNAVYLRFWVGATSGEIAQALRVPVGTVRSDLTRAMARLRECCVRS